MLEKLKEIIAEIDEETDVTGVTEDSTLTEDVGMSSITILYMAVALEEKFGIDLKEFNMENIKTVGDVIREIEKQTK
ncbi:MAG: acyl carrier protein [Parasporobacterium sp.]|nr:acyl carrier protein [Parasporobacterium sp.]